MTAIRNRFKAGDRVVVHQPRWKDASGRCYSPGDNHGRFGTVIELPTDPKTDTPYQVGANCLVTVRFDEDSKPRNGARAMAFNRYMAEAGCWDHWSDELRKLTPSTARARQAQALLRDSRERSKARTSPISECSTTGPVQSTRFAALGFQHRTDHWRIIDLSWTPDCGLPSGVGPLYKSRAELLGDLDRFAAAFGWGEPQPKNAQ